MIYISERWRLSSKQIFFLIFCVTSSSMLLSGTTVIKQSEQDAWLSLLVAIGVNAIIAVILYILGLRYPNQTIYQYSEAILGKLLGKLIGFIFLLFFLFMGSLFLRTTTDFLSTALMPETPAIVFSIVILLVSIYAVNSGLEVLARLSELVSPLVMLFLFILLLFNAKGVKLENLQPAFQHVKEIIKISVLPSALIGSSIVMGVFMAYHNIPEKTLKAQLFGLVTGGVFLILILMQSITVLGVNLSAEQTHFIYRLAQMINVGDFFERFEPLEVIVWIAVTFITITTFYLLSLIGLAQLLKLKKYQTISPLIGITMLFLSEFLFHSVVDRFHLTKGTIFPYTAITIEALLPTLLLIVSLIKHSKKNSNRSNSRI